MKGSASSRKCPAWSLRHAETVCYTLHWFLLMDSWKDQAATWTSEVNICFQPIWMWKAHQTSTAMACPFPQPGTHVPTQPCLSSNWPYEFTNQPLPTMDRRAGASAHTSEARTSAEVCHQPLVYRTPGQRARGRLNTALDRKTPICVQQDCSLYPPKESRAS